MRSNVRKMLFPKIDRLKSLIKKRRRVSLNLSNLGDDIFHTLHWSAFRVPNLIIQPWVQDSMDEIRYR